jgi:hypothetical protein
VLLLDGQGPPEAGNAVDDVDPVAASDVDRAQAGVGDELGGKFSALVIVGGVELAGRLPADDRAARTSGPWVLKART